MFDLVTDSLKMAIYHDHKTAPPFKCSFKPSLEFNMMNTAFVTSTAFKKLICVQHRGRCAELARRATLWCSPNELFVQSSWQLLLDAVSRARSPYCFNYIETIPAPPIFAHYWARVSKVCINIWYKIKTQNCLLTGRAGTLLFTQPLPFMEMV